MRLLNLATFVIVAVEVIIIDWTIPLFNLWQVEHEIAYRLKIYTGIVFSWSCYQKCGGLRVGRMVAPPQLPCVDAKGAMRGQARGPIATAKEAPNCLGSIRSEWH